MTAASCSDALRLVIAQKLLNNQKMATFEALVYVSPMCLLFMAPVALFKVKRPPELQNMRASALLPSITCGCNCEAFHTQEH
eukprot:scaffold63946_cov31-Tisochrysis_lutea.AAC.3